MTELEWCDSEVSAVTLNITVSAPSYIIQASDRQMVSLGRGPIADDSNKGMVLQTDDGVFAITFAGVGQFQRQGLQRIDLWLAERILDNGIPELPIREGIERIAELSNQLFRQFPKDSNSRHSFVIAGWDANEPGQWILSNCTAQDGRTMTAVQNDVFDIRYTSLAGQSSVLITGIWEAVPRHARRRISAALRANADVSRLERILVETIRIAAAQPVGRNLINGNVLTIAITNGKQVYAVHHPEDSSSLLYAPVFLWYKDGRNYVAGDAWAIPSERFAYRFGKTMLTPLRGQTVSKIGEESGGIDFAFRYASARYKRDPLGAVDIVELVQL